MSADELRQPRASLLRAAEPSARAVIALFARRGLPACRVRAVGSRGLAGVALVGDARSARVPVCRVRMVEPPALAGVSFVDGPGPARVSVLRKRVAA